MCLSIIQAGVGVFVFISPAWLSLSHHTTHITHTHLDTQTYARCIKTRLSSRYVRLFGKRSLKLQGFLYSWLFELSNGYMTAIYLSSLLSHLNYCDRNCILRFERELFLSEAKCMHVFNIIIHCFSSSIPRTSRDLYEAPKFDYSFWLRKVNFAFFV